MRYRLSFGIIALLVLSLSLCACSMVKEKQQKDDFNKKTEDFTLRMQWGDFVGVSLHFQEDLREGFLERFEDWETLKITNVETSRVESELDGAIERKIAHYKLEYYLLTDMKVRKQKIEIVWELAPETDKKGSYWRIVKPFPTLEAEKK